ncbi:MAG TPA: hypothetical protein VJ161_10195 [Geobacteraceae bacterium]|nr:hypothetical protein [Geobacteraceae bacterium]
MRKLMLMAMGVVLTSLLIAGCGGGSSSTADGGNGDGTPTAVGGTVQGSAK